MNSKQILVTGGRAPATLELVRLLGSVCTVYVTDSIDRYLSQYSNQIKGSFTTPSPRFNTEEYIQSLLKIIDAQKIDILIPTCEEIFFIGEHLDRLSAACEVFSMHKETLVALHNKQTFAHAAKPEGVSSPETRIVSSRAEIVSFMETLGVSRIILKPSYSRFSNKTMLVTAETLPENLSFHATNPLLAQVYVEGEQLCSYTIARKGKIKAFSSYSSPFTIGLGTCITFANNFDARIFTWVEKFVKEYEFTGQIAFDFIIGEHEEPKVIECNPRLTSGIHLFANGGKLAATLLGESAQVLFAETPGRKLTVPLLLALPGLFLHPTTIKPWMTSLFTFKDVLYDARDRTPFFRQIHIVADIAKQARKRKISLSEASTYDIEWNGAA